MNLKDKLLSVKDSNKIYLVKVNLTAKKKPKK